MTPKSYDTHNMPIPLTASGNGVTRTFSDNYGLRNCLRLSPEQQRLELGLGNVRDYKDILPASLLQGRPFDSIAQRLAPQKLLAPYGNRGEHLVFVLGGIGLRVERGVLSGIMAGQSFLVIDPTRCAVRSLTSMVLLVVTTCPQPVTPARLRPETYRNVASSEGVMTCTECDRTAALPFFLHEIACPHCPCDKCLKERFGGRL